MKKIFFLLVCTLLSALSAQNSARIDISGIGSNVPLKFPENQQCRISYGTWNKAENIEKYITASFPGSDHWQKGRLEFIPENDGKLLIYLMGPHVAGSRASANRPCGVYYDEIRINGKAAANGGFESGSKYFGFINKEKALPGRIVFNPLLSREGSNCLLAWHDGQAFFSLPVKAGTPQVLTFYYRSAGDVRPIAQENYFYPLNLKNAANMGFADETAKDGKGGWTDQGPENDLRTFKGGLQAFEGYPFQILEPEKNNGKSCVVFQSENTPFGKESITLPVHQLCNELLLLNTCAWAKQGVAPVTVEVVFSSGKTERFPLKTGQYTADWWNPKNLPGAGVVWKSGVEAGEVGLYLTKLKLKRGEKVRELRISSNHTPATFILVGALAAWKNSDLNPLAAFRFTVPLKGGRKAAAVPFSVLKLEMMKKGISSALLPDDEKSLSRLQVLDENGKPMKYAVARFTRDFSNVLLVRNPEKSRRLNLRFGDMEQKNTVLSPRAAFRAVCGKSEAEYPEMKKQPGILIDLHQLKASNLPVIADEDSFYEQAVRMYHSGKAPEFQLEFNLPEIKKLKLYLYSRSPVNHTNSCVMSFDGGKEITVGGNFYMPPYYYWSGGERITLSSGKHTLKVKGRSGKGAEHLAVARIFLAETLHTPTEPDLTDELEALEKSGFEVFGFKKERIAEQIPNDTFYRITNPAKSYPDLSSLVPNEIDSRGFARRTGSTIRFDNGAELKEIWGCNMGGDKLLKEMAGHRLGEDSLDRYLRRIKALGYTVLRLQVGTLLQIPAMMENNLKGPLAHLNPVTYQTDLPEHIHKLIAACHRNGVYLMISPWNDNCLFLDLGANRSQRSYIGFFHPEAIRRQQEFVKMLLTSPNPYRNGIPPVKDPTLLICEIENERTFVWFSQGKNTSDWRKLKPETREILYRRWTEFLKRKYASAEQLLKAWNVTDPKTVLRSGKTTAVPENIEFPPVWDVREWSADKTQIKVKMDDLRISESAFGNDRKSNPAVSDGMEFMYEVYRDYLKTMAGYIRSLGFKGLVTACGADCEQHYAQRMAANEVLDLVSGGTGYWNRTGYGFLRTLGWLSPLVYAASPDTPVISREYGGNLVHETSWWGNLIAAGIQKAMGKAYLFNFSLGFPDRRNTDWFYPRDTFDLHQSDPRNQPGAARQDYNQERHLYSHFANLAAAVAVRSEDLKKSPFKLEIADPLENVCYTAQFRGYNKLTMGSYIPFLYADSSVRTYKGAYNGNADLVVNEPSLPGGDYSGAKNLFLLKPHSIFDRHGSAIPGWFKEKKFQAEGFMNKPSEKEAFYAAMQRAGLKFPVAKQELGTVWRDPAKKLELNTRKLFFKGETDTWSAFIGNAEGKNGKLRAYDVSGCGDAWSFYGKLPDSQWLFFLILNGKVRLNTEAPSYLFLAGKEIELENAGKPLVCLRAGETVNLGIKTDSDSIDRTKRLYVTFFRPKSCIMPAELSFGREIKSVKACAADGSVLCEIPAAKNGFANLWAYGPEISYYTVEF